VKNETNVFADFIQTISDFQDLMMSAAVKEYTYPEKSAFGTDLPN
jgi:hypothetical protein